MKFSIAISFCDEDTKFAEKLWLALKRRRAGSYYYKKDPKIGPLILGYHQSIYTNAYSRIYLLRNRSFVGKIVSFELLCGRGLSNNFVVPTEASVVNEIPNDFLFISDSGWNWLPSHQTSSAAFIASTVLKEIS
jgi:hypothetical protein